MAKNQWGDEPAVAEDPRAWGDKPAAQRDLPADVAPSTAGAGRGSVNPDPVEPGVPVQSGPVDTSDPMLRVAPSTGATNPTFTVSDELPQSVLRGKTMPEQPFDPAEGARLSDRGYAERTPLPDDPRRTAPIVREGRPARRAMADQGLVAGDDPLPVRMARKAGAGAAEGAYGVLRAGAEAVGADDVARFAKESTGAAREFQEGMGQAKPVAGFGPNSPVPYLTDMAEGAGSSLLSSGVMAATFGPGAVIPLMSIQSAGQQYDRAREAGQDPAAALANALPYGVFEAVGEKFQGLDKAASALGVLMNQGSSAMAKRTAADVLVRSGVREIPGEVLTYLGQTGVDLLPGIGINQNLTMSQFLDGLRDTVVQSAMMGAPQVLGGRAAQPAPRRQPGAEEIARSKGFLVDEKGKIERLRAAGETEAAAVLQRRLDVKAADGELEGLRGQPFHSPAFEQQYRTLRASGVKPAEASAKAAMLGGFAQMGGQVGLSTKAVTRASEEAAKLPLDKVPGFLDRFMATLTGKGLGTPVPEGAVAGALEAAGDQAMGAAIDTVYAEKAESAVDRIGELVGAAPAAQAPAAEPSAETFDAGNDVLVTPEADTVHQAATSPLNDLPEPTEAQKAAGNYRVGRLRIAGLDISVENPQGSVRRGTDADGKAWESPMRSAHYGYIRQTEAKDGDKLDVFVKPGTPDDFAGPVFVVDQIDPKSGKLDEHKVILGAADQAEAESIYRSAYDANWQGLGAITALPLPAFKAWAQSGKLKEPLGDISQARPQAAAEAAAPAPVPAAVGGETAVQPRADGADRQDGQAVERDGALNAAPQTAPKPEPFFPAGAQVESIGATGTRSKAGDRARSRAYEANPFKAFLGKHGLASDLASEFAPGTTERRAALVPGYGPVFRKSGKQIDDLAQAAVEEGFLTEPDVPTLEAMIDRALRGERIIPQYAEGVAENEMQAMIDRQRELEEDAAEDLGALSDLELDVVEDVLDDVPAIDAQSNVSLESAMRSMGFTEQEISDAIAEKPAVAQADRQGGGQPEQAAAAQAPGTAGGREGQARSQVAPEPTQTPADAGVSVSGPEFVRNGSGTLTVRGDPAALMKLLADNGITRVMRAKTGVLVGKTEADKAERFLSKRRKAPKAAPKPQTGKPLTLGMTPSSAEPVTVKDGVVYVGKSEALDFDSGEPITVPASATDAQIKKALQDGGAISRRQHFYGGEEGAKSGTEPGLTAPTKDDVLEQQRRREEGDKAEAKAKQEREAKAKADAERDEFRLSGSDRAADANPDQGAMFARGARDDTRDLIVQHNITAENILHAQRMGGMAVPSLAITKADHPMENFGEVTLLGDKAMATPKGDTKFFGADIYSPRYPQVTYRVVGPAVASINKTLAPYRKEGDSQYYGGADEKADDLTSYKPFVRWAEEKAGKTLGYHDLRAEADQMFADVGAQERLFQGFTYSGNRRYKAHTLDNVVAVLKKELRGGENFNYGAGSLRAKFTPQFRSIAAIKAAKGALVEKAAFEKLKDEVNKELLDLAYEMVPNGGFRSSDTAISILEDAAKMGLDRAAKEYDIELSDSTKEKAREFMAKLRNMPTEYFEGKITRAVSLSEFKAAIVPSDLRQDARKALTDAGLPLYEYKRGDEADRRRAVQEAAKATPDAMFSRQSMSDEEVAAVMRLLAVQRGGLPTEKAQKIVDGLTAKWKNGPKVTVVATHRELPVKAPADARGLYYKGQVWVVAAAHRDGPQVRKTVARTLAHEAISHYGLRELLGRDGWARLMRQINAAIAAGNKPLKEIQAEIRRLYVDEDGNFNLSPNIEADEIAARVVEEAIDASGEFRPGFGFVKAVYAKIAEFLRSLGIDVAFTNAELHGMLVLAQRNLEVGKRTAGGGEVLVAAAREPGQMLRAFHGSPHEFDAFDMGKVGTGEGNQAYGFGLYFASQREVADYYRESLSPRGPATLEKALGVPMDEADALWAAARVKTGELKADMSAERLLYARSASLRKLSDAERSKLLERAVEVMQAKRGKLYEVEIPEDGAYLLWDRPLSEQPEAVKKALAKIDRAGLDRDTQKQLDATGDKLNGGTFYSSLVIDDNIGSQRAASELLHSLGIAGIKYMDGASRNRPLRELKREFLKELPQDAGFDEVTELFGTGTFSPANEAILKELQANDWLGFDYPAQAVSAALGGELANFDASDALKQAVADAQQGATFNYVVFDDSAVEIRAQFSLRSTVAEDAEATAPDLSPWRDATGRLQFAPGVWLYDRMGKLSGPLLAKVGMKPMSKELKRQMREMKLAVQKAQETAAAVAGEAMKLSEDERGMVSDLIEQELAAGTVPPAHAVRLAAMINDSMGAQTDELVRLGMLTKDSADLWRGKYLPRFYKNKLTRQVGDAWADALRQLRGRQKVMAGIKGKHLKGRGLYETVPASAVADWEALGWEVRDPDYPAGDASEISLKILSGQIAPEDTVQVWRDFTRAERDKMGEIRDAGFRFVMGYMQTQRDIALGRMFEGLAASPEMSSKRQSDTFTVQVPDGTVPGTGAKRYGKLAGRWVSRETMSHLSQLEEAQSEAWRMYRKALALWKESKTALNPVSHVNNTVSNITMAHFAGVSYWQADKYIAAARDFATKAPALQQAKDAGLFLGTMSDAELMNTLPAELKALVRQQDSGAAKIGRTAFNVMTFWLRKPMGWAYQAEDTFFRYLLWKDATGRGLDPKDAVDWAQKFIFAYDDLPKGARMVRDFGIPFFAYTYKAAPALLETALTHPLRFAAPAAVLWGINAAAYAIAGGDDDDEWMDSLTRYLTDPAFRAKVREDEQLERENLPPWLKGKTALLTPKVIRLGMDEVSKLPLFIDTARIVPGGDLFDVSPNAGGIPLPQPITPSHPLFTTAVAMLANKDMFFGKELVDSNDTRAEAAAKRADWLWKQFTPAVAVGNYHFERGMNALAQATGEPVRWLPEAVSDNAEVTGIGRDGLPVQPKYAAMQTFGIKVRPFDLDRSAEIGESLKAKMIREIDAEMRSLRRLNAMGAVSDSVYEKAADKADEKKDRIREGLTVDGEPRN